MRISFLIASLIFILSLPSFSQEKKVEFTPHLFKNNNDLYLVLEYKHFNDWHTYFKNPGDSGEPTTFLFFIGDKEIKLEEPLWPFPKTFKYGSVNTYGYNQDFALFFKLDNTFLNQKIKIQTSWLGCKNICVPGKDEKEIELNQNNFHEDLLFKRYFENLPSLINSPLDLNLNLIRDEINKKIIIYYSFKKELLANFPSNHNLLIPLTTNNFGIGAEKLNLQDNIHLSGTMEGSFDGEYLEPPKPFPTLSDIQNNLTFTFLYLDPNTKKTYQFNHRFISANPSINSFAPKEQTSTPVTIWYYIALALLGGIILNFMPCVLPVISLKLFGLIKYREISQKKILFHNLSYTVGVLLSFLLLAGFVITIKSIGRSVGWGFQLQSPTFVGIMTLIIFIFSLNLFGLFEFITPGGKILGNIKLKDGFLSDFASGILAVILSTPCSAPLLGTALTFAFTTTSLNIIIIFLTIGFGLAFPFILTGIFPQTLIILPRPGNWMNHFKKFLGFSLLLTSIWLVSVLTSLINQNIIWATLIPAMIATFFVFYNPKRLIKFRLVFLILSLVFFTSFIFINQSTTDQSKINSLKLISEKQALGLNFSLWNPDYKYPSDQISFIDFSATWCLTCKVNEEIILNTLEFKSLVKKYNLNLLLADWTSGDKDTTNWLREHGCAGVPAYFIVSKNHKFYDLGETITNHEIEENIKKALSE